MLCYPKNSQLEGKSGGDTIEVPIDCNKLYGPRDESLVIAENIHDVPEEYRKVGTAILMENDKGQARTFTVTRIAEDVIFIDGNNPLCGREVVFKLEILSVRDATDEEIEHGGKLDHYASIGVTEAVLRLPAAGRDEVLPVLDDYAQYLEGRAKE